MRLPSSRIKLTVLTTFAAFFAAIAICQIFEWLGFPEQDQVTQIRALAGMNWKFVAVVAWILLATPVIEEFLFRYLLFRLPSRLFSSAFSTYFLFSVFSSALFSFCHYIDFNSIAAGRGFALLPISNAFLALFGLGLFWCWLYRRTGAIWCNMLSHAIFNSVNLILALLLPVS